MKKLLWIAVFALAFGAAVAAEAPVVIDTEPVEVDARTCEADDVALEQAARGKGKPGGGEACCDPALEPGGGTVPFCFEGHTCCSDGNWRCNNPDATPSCDAGTVCDAGCGSTGASCSSGADCCSGNCKKNGVCR